MITLHGIKNCDSVKKARKWFDNHGIEYHFVDFRTDGIDAKSIASWINSETLSALVNKRSTTWKALDSSEQASIAEWVAQAAEGDDKAKLQLAAALADNATLIKRPVVIDDQQQITIGFNAETYQSLFS